MSKKLQNTNEDVNNPSLRELMDTYGNVSIHKIANTANITYGLILKKSKQPIEGVPYDPEAVNFEAVEKYLEGRKVDWLNLPWDEMNSTESKAVLMKDHTKFVPGMKVYLRSNADTPYEILIKTETHIVFMLEGTSEPRAWSINTFMLNGPSLEPRTKKVEEKNDMTYDVCSETIFQ